jgi:hypothetical protein
MPILHGIYFDPLFKEKYIVVRWDTEDNIIYAIWLGEEGSFISKGNTSCFPLSSMQNDVYCGQATDLVISLL